MYGYISIINISSYPVISAIINDTLIFKDILTYSGYKACPSGSARVIILDNREHIIFDLYLPIYQERRHILKVGTNSCILTQAESS